MSTGPAIVVGGGLVGLSCAWFLREAGVDVTVVEADPRPGGGASRGNAGAICPSMTEPLPAPGMIREALSDIGRSDAALYVHPMTAPRMAGFLARFAAAATPERFERGRAAMVTLACGVIDAYDALATAGIGSLASRDGYLFVHADQAAAEAERDAVARMHAMGCCAAPGEVIGGADLLDEEPLLGPAAGWGFVLDDERSIDPSRFVDDLEAALSERGVRFVLGDRVTRIDDPGHGVQVHTGSGERLEGEVAVVAAGAWTRDLLVPLGVRLQLAPGKGYSFAVRPNAPARRTLHLSSAHVMATPMGERLRIAGTMEFDGSMDRFRPGRIEAIVTATQPFVDVDLSVRTEEWVGPRPMTPDGLPYLGRVPGHDRVVVAAGHNMLGLTLAPVTGRVIAGLLAEDDPGVDLVPFAVGR